MLDRYRKVLKGFTSSKNKRKWGGIRVAMEFHKLT